MTTKRIGRYEIEKELGRGAMAVVYKAVDPLIGRTVAIKTIRIEHGLGMEREELRQRLYREAQSAGGMNHPGIVTIYDIGQEEDVAYIAMEFVDGQTLEGWMAEHPIPPLEQTLAIVEQVALGLDYAAGRGIIHRDIKPGNILITEELKAKIADFGIAKISMSKLTQTGMVMGTPSYMSPEQAMGKELDGRSDLFSLGVIFYEMLTGERPFTGTNPTTIIYKILHEDPVSPRKLNVTLHAGLDFIVRKMLEKDPSQRYQTCGDFIRDLKNYTALPPAPSMPIAAPASAGSTSRRSALIFFAALVLITGLAGGYFYYRFYQPAREEPMVPPPAPAVSIGSPAVKGTEASGKVQTAQDATKITPPETAIAGTTDVQGGLTAKKTAVPEEPVKTQPAPEKKAEEASKDEVKPTPPKPAPAVVKLEFSGPTYPVALFEGRRKLRDFDDTGSLEVPAGPHQFRVVSQDVFLDLELERERLASEKEFAITLPGLGSAYISVPNDAYEGCEILLNDILLPTPYPAPIPKLAAGTHRILFRWTTGKYAGKEVSSTFTTLEGHHFLIAADPESGKVNVQQAR
jgi:tRNA A-37 threonylcarbamoyl transferase component Bud32